jgi:hypothetical protein
VIYLVGSAFVGIAFQPFVYMLIGLQCGLWSYLKRIEKPLPPTISREMKPLGNSGLHGLKPIAPLPTAADVQGWSEVR